MGWRRSLHPVGSGIRVPDCRGSPAPVTVSIEFCDSFVNSFFNAHFPRPDTYGRARDAREQRVSALPSLRPGDTILATPKRRVPSFGRSPVSGPSSGGEKGARNRTRRIVIKGGADLPRVLGEGLREFRVPRRAAGRGIIDVEVDPVEWPS